MKSIKLLAVSMSLLMGLTGTSCIKDEEPNTEADILECILPQDILTRQDIDVYRPYDDEIKAYPIYLPIKKGTDVSKLAINFKLTENATIEPANGSVQDFRYPVRYTVTSEDKQWHRTYAVFAKEPKRIPTIYHFETAKIGQYHILYEQDGEKELTWGSGNGGFKLAVPSAATEEYPTMLSPDGYKGNCVKMVTRETGSLGELVKMPIASGNLFSGRFDIGNALSKPLEATKFGEPFNYKPISLKGYFRYKAGDKFFENGKEVNRKDMMNIYAIFYESTSDTPMLDGNIQENNYEHPNMVALAIMKNPHETQGDAWEEFKIDFDYNRYGKKIDAEKLAAGKYHLGIVFAASVDGANFAGAPGSTLMVDEMELIYE